MNDRDRLKTLKTLADLLRDRDLASLSQAQAAKDRTESLLRALDHAAAPTLPETTVAAQVTEKFGLWATNRRIVLNQQYARDTAKWLTEREAAQTAFGRAEVLRRLIERS